MIILGIDPGSVRIGYGAIRKEHGTLSVIECGLLPLRGLDRAARLVELSAALQKVLKRTKPDRVGIEKLYFSKNQKTALEVAEARGVLLHTVIAHRIRFVEFTPGEVKLGVTGDGRAPKRAVASMVERTLHLPPEQRMDDVTDALAIAIVASHAALYEAGMRR